MRDVSISVEQGSSIGLVGANGSGKSTLLKLLNGVTLPYAGRIDVTGRIGALIEVRSGIHPELSGRENAFIVGALLGLSRRDVARRFDEIVEFSELDRAIDRQVKYYSTGMQMRLGFAVAAFLEPDVLLVDEVLAVGDAAFQQRCLDRMRMVMSRGTTLVFVSHDLAAIEATCAQALWMGEGRALAGGPVGDVLCAYRLAVEHQLSVEGSDAGPIRLLKARVVGPDGGAPRTQERLDVALVFESDAEEIARVCIGVSEGSAAPVFTVWRDLHLVGGSGDTPVRCSIRQLPLPRGRYRVCAGVYGREPSGAGGVSDLMSWRPVAEFDVSGPDLDPTPPAILRLAPVHVAVEWEVG